MSGTLTFIATQLEYLKAKQDELDRRLTAVERWRFALPLTGISAMTAAAGAVTTALVG